MATREAYITAVHPDGTFDFIHIGPQIEEHVDPKFFLGRDGEAPVKGQAVQFEYADGNFLIVPVTA